MTIACVFFERHHFPNAVLKGALLLTGPSHLAPQIPGVLFNIVLEPGQA